MGDPLEVHAQRDVDRHADPEFIHLVTRELLTSLHANAAAAGLELVGDTVEVYLHAEPIGPFLTSDRVIVRATAPARPIPEETRRA